MEIKTKFKVGDRVYFIGKTAMFSGIIQYIRIRISKQSGYDAYYGIATKKICGDNECMELSEDCLFESWEALFWGSKKINME